MPNWVFESNDENGKNVNDNLNKTTGIKYLIEGVADAYINANKLWVNFLEVFIVGLKSSLELN